VYMENQKTELIKKHKLDLLMKDYMDRIRKRKRKRSNLKSSFNIQKLLNKKTIYFFCLISFLDFKSSLRKIIQMFEKRCQA